MVNQICLAHDSGHKIMLNKHQVHECYIRPTHPLPSASWRGCDYELAEILCISALHTCAYFSAV